MSQIHLEAPLSQRIRSRKRAKEDICRLLKSKSSVSHDEPNNNISCSVSGEQPLNLCVRDVDSPVIERIKSAATTGSVSTRRRKKRSAIFVPPEKLSNEVCICKFKFVAGHQPRLQEKKVLSIDSGGNFKFFPEIHSSSSPDPPESPLNPTLVQHSPTAESPLVPMKPIPDLIPIQSLPPLPATSEPVPVTSVAATRASVPPATTPAANKVRKLSRRQKLEQTFREKGFLIQTQHVQATEGAVFCKFRQLKKFTRYLYRSWRNYLPEDGRPDKASLPNEEATNQEIH